MKRTLLVLCAGLLCAAGLWKFAGAQHNAAAARVATATVDGMLQDSQHQQRRSAKALDCVQLCQYTNPYLGEQVQGVDCASQCPCTDNTWKSATLTPWNTYNQGEYVGHERSPHVPAYRLRPDDEIEFVFRVTRDETPHPYRLNVGDEVSVRSFTDEKLNTTAVVQPDGTITLPLLPPVRAARQTTEQLREDLERQFSQYYKMPTISVSLLRGNTKLEDLRATVDSRFGQGGQSRLARVTPEGNVQLPALGSVPAQGLTLDELGREINARYQEEIEGIEITPVLSRRAPRYVYVLGEVRTPGRYQLEGPTTVMQAIAMAGSWNVGARLKQIVVFRRGDDWRLMATKLDLQNTLWGNSPCPADEIWVNDSDVILVPKSQILLMDDFINLVFTRGIYGVIPFSSSYAFNDFTRL